MPDPRYSRYGKITAILITILLIAILITQISLNDVIATLTQINPFCLLAAFGLYICTYFFRAWRFHILLNKEVSIKDLFHIEGVHNMMNYLLPARTGELSYVYLLKTEQNKTTAEGLASLIIARIFDFIIISILFLLFFLFVHDLPPAVIAAVFLGILVLFLMVSFLFGLLFYGNAFLKIQKEFAYYLNFGTIPVGDYITKKSEEIIDCFEKFKTDRSEIHISVIILSTGIWVMSYSVYYLIAISMHIPSDTIQILFAVSFAVFSTVLPIQGIGGFGTMEGGWALGFISVGLSKEVAINTGFGFHLVLLAFCISLGISGYVNIWLERIRKISS
jgi:glycosyltransferase 2 family protein